MLLKKVNDPTFEVSREEDPPVKLASGWSIAFNQDGGKHCQLMQTISTLTETVSKLQEELKVVSNKVKRDQAAHSNLVDTGQPLAREQRPKDNGFILHTLLMPKC